MTTTPNITVIAGGIITPGTQQVAPIIKDKGMLVGSETALIGSENGLIGNRLPVTA